MGGKQRQGYSHECPVCRRRILVDNFIRHLKKKHPEVFRARHQRSMA